MKTTGLYRLMSIAGVCILAFGCPSAQKPGAPAITSVTPASVVKNVNTNITITGSGFLNGLTVQIGAIQGAIVNSVDSTSIVATIVAGLPAGTYDVTVTNIDGQKATKSQALTVTNPGPLVSGVSPSIGVNNADTSITVFGNGFLTGASVKVGASSCTVTTVGSNSISAVVPSGIAAGTYAVSVTNSDSQSGSLNNAFTVRNPAPTVTDINPTTGRQTLTTSVTITGNYFQSGATVSIGATSCGSVSVPNSTTITCTVPSGMGAGVYSVTVTNSDSQSGTLSNAFTIVPPPAISGVSPSYGGATLTTPVTISGGGFQAGLAVTIGASTLCTNIVFVNSSVVQCVVPTMPAGVYAVSVTNSDGQSGSLSNAFTVYAAPTVSGVSPTTATNNQNTSVVIAGSNFRAGATVTMSAGASSYIIQVNSVSSGSINALVLSGAPAGGYTVYVTNIEGQTGASLAGALTVRNPAPQVTGITPTFGVAGTGVTITGVNFTTSGATTVTIGGVACSGVVVNSTTSLTCTVGAIGVGTWSVTVTNPDGQSGSLSNAFTRYPAPTVSSIFPTSGPNNSPTPVAIVGTGFLSGATVTMAGTSGTATLQGVVVNTSASISAIVGWGIAPGSYTIYVNNPDGQRGTCACTFVVYQGPRITTINPSSGYVGTLLYITGTSFGSFQGSSTVTVNGVDASVYSWSDTQVVAFVPSEASCGPIVVTVSGVPSNAVNFNVLPRITTVTPNYASVNNRMVIIGSGFNISPVFDQVSFNGVGASISAVTSTGFIITNQPIAATGISVAVQITNTACNLASNIITFTTVTPGTPSPFVAGAYGLWDINDLSSGGAFVSSQLNHGVLRVFDNPFNPTEPYFLTLSIPQLNQPAGLAVDSRGNLFVANSATSGPNPNSVIKAYIDQTSNLVTSSTIVATGFNNPQDVVIDGNDTLYVADSGNNRVTRRTAGGTITAAWATGLNGPRGMAIRGNNLWVTNAAGNSVSKVDINAGGAPLATYSGGLSTPSGIAFDKDECVFYVTNRGANTVSRLYPSGGNANSTYVDNTQGLNLPMGIQADKAGEFIVANNSTAIAESGNAVAVIQPNTLTLTNVTGVPFTCPYDMDYDSRGNLFYTTTGCGSYDVVMLPPTGPAVGLNITSVGCAIGIVVDDANPPNIFVSDVCTGNIIRYTLWGSSVVYSDGPSTGGTYPCLGGIDLDGAGNIYTVDNCTQVLYQVPAGQPLPTKGNTLGGILSLFPVGVTVNRADGFVDVLSVGCGGGDTVYRVNPSSGAATVLASLPDSCNIEFLSSDECGNIYAANASVGVVYKITPLGQVSTYLSGPPLACPTKVSFSTTTTGGVNTGGMYSLDTCSSVVRKVNFSASRVAYGRGPVESPQGLALDSNLSLYVSDDRPSPALDSINKTAFGYPLSFPFTSTSFIETPKGLEFDRDGNLYVGSWWFGTILKFDPLGNVIPPVPFVPCCGAVPWGMSFSGGVFDLFVADQLSWAISRVDSGGSASYDYFFPNLPSYLDHDASGNLYIGIQGGGGNDIYRRIASSGTTAAFIAGTGNISGVAVDTVSSTLYFARSGSNIIRKAPLPSGAPVTTFVPVVAGSLYNLNNPQGLVVDPLTGSLYVANQGNNTIYRIAP